MRVLIVNRFFGEPDVPTGRMAFAVAKELAVRGFEVSVLTGSGAYTLDRVHERSSLDDIQVKHLVGTSGGRAWSWIAFWCQAMVLIPFSTWDRCVLLTDPPFLIAAAPLAKAAGLKRRIYWWTMDLYPEALRADGVLKETNLAYRLLRRVNEFGLGSIDGVIALGDRQVKRLRTYRAWKERPDFVTLVPPWDERAVTKVSSEKNRIIERFGWNGKRVLLYAGNLGRGHTYRPALDAARLLHEQGDETWVFAFFCRGWHREALAREAESLSNLVVSDYVAHDETAELLHAADVHLITMEEGWEGIVVPTKLSGVMHTRAPVLFIGPSDADTATEIRQHEAGLILPNQCSGRDVIQTINTLISSKLDTRSVPPAEGAARIVNFITR